MEKGWAEPVLYVFCFFYLFWRRISFHFMSALFLLLLKKLIRKYFLQTFQSAAKETRFLCFVVQFLFWPISSFQVCSLYPQPAIWAWPVSRSSLQIDEKHSNRCWRHTYNVELKKFFSCCCYKDSKHTFQDGHWTLKHCVADMAPVEMGWLMMAKTVTVDRRWILLWRKNQCLDNRDLCKCFNL